MSRFEEQILRAVQGRHPLIYLRTSEEERVIDALKPILPKAFPGGSITTWSCVRGLEPPAKTDTKDPVAALEELRARPRPGFCVMEDLADFLDDHRVTRSLREFYFSSHREFKSCLVLVSPGAKTPEALEKEIALVELDAPSAAELLACVDGVAKGYPQVQMTGALRSQIGLALRGLTIMEAEHVMHRTFSSGKRKDEMMDEIFAEKQALAKKAGFLQYVPVKFDVSKVGGLENVKDWAASRKSLFTQESVDAGIPAPKGVLIMGVSGCGKSMLAKAIAGLWKVPLFRLDMSLVFSGAYGSPEEAFHRALATIESLAPVVMWIDEMEAALSTPKDAATPQAMAFGAFLTWMQEKPPLVFVAATANRIEMLPAEIIRKGRFDQVFFCDLPGKEEREEILSIHIQANGAHPGDFDLGRLVYRMEGWSGAEIEQAVISARIEAHQAGRSLGFEDVRRQCDLMVPLSKTMSEQIKRIRDWAHTRATRASRYGSET